MQMREITTHQIDGLPKDFARDLRVFAGEGDKFGVPHHYELSHDNYDADDEARPIVVTLTFQSGDPRKGWNGGTTLAYLAAIYDFLTACQRSQFGCEENAKAMMHVEIAIESLQARIRRRAAEGTFQTHQAEKPPAAAAADAEDD